MQISMVTRKKKRRKEGKKTYTTRLCQFHYVSWSHPIRSTTKNKYKNTKKNLIRALISNVFCLTNAVLNHCKHDRDLLLLWYSDWKLLWRAIWYHIPNFRQIRMYWLLFPRLQLLREREINWNFVIKFSINSNTI